MLRLRCAAGHGHGDREGCDTALRVGCQVPHIFKGGDGVVDTIHGHVREALALECGPKLGVQLHDPVELGQGLVEPIGRHIGLRQVVSHWEVEGIDRGRAFQYGDRLLVTAGRS
jgi:hypothetical protein